ncbi:MAG: hypothetical protein ACTHKG_11740 [Nocardioides sp.]
MGKSGAHDVGVADSYARRTTDSVVLTLHLPKTDAVDAGGVRLTSLGKGPKRRVDVAAQTAASEQGVVVTATVPRAEVEPGRWQLRLRTADGSGYRRARARLLVRPDQPVALMVGPTPLTLMAPPKPRARAASRPEAGHRSTAQSTAQSTTRSRAQAARARLAGVARRVRRLSAKR